jgi:hypothetical protein
MNTYFGGRIMNRIFLPDGGPDAEDFDNNYFTYDESNIETTAKINHILKNCDTQDPKTRILLATICTESFHRESPTKPLIHEFSVYICALNIFKTLGLN